MRRLKTLCSIRSQVRYCVPMPTPSATGAQFFRVEKSFFQVPVAEWANVGQALQVNHIMSTTGDARSAVRATAVETPPEGLASFGFIFGVAMILLFILAIFYTGSTEGATVGVDEGDEEVVWACTEFWSILVAIGVLVPIWSLYKTKARYENAAKQPEGTCEQVPTADLDAAGAVQAAAAEAAAAMVPVLAGALAQLPGAAQSLAGVMQAQMQQQQQQQQQQQNQMLGGMLIDTEIQV